VALLKDEAVQKRGGDLKLCGLIIDQTDVVSGIGEALDEGRRFDNTLCRAELDETVGSRNGEVVGAQLMETQNEGKERGRIV